MADMKLSGVIFDMDGVLCDSEPFICRAAVQFFHEYHQLTVQAEDFEPFVGTGENRYLGGVAEKYGRTLDLPSDKRRLYEIYLRIIRGRLQPIKGALDFVAACRRRGLRLAVATSADRIKMDGNLAEIGLPPEQFDACITGDDVRRKKPHPDIFLKAAETLGLSAGECLVVEDAPSGIQAGKAAGARCLGLTSSFNAATLNKAGADWTAPDLDHAPADLLALCGGQ